MTAPLPALPSTASTWDQALYAFLVEKGNRSGSRRTVESYSRMLWRFFAVTTPDQVRARGHEKVPTDGQAGSSQRRNTDGVIRGV